MITKNIWIMNHYRNAVCAIVATLAATAAMAQSAIEAVTGTMQGGAEVVRVELSQPLAAVPTGFAIQSPARIALDFPGTTNSMGRSVVDVNQGNLKSINIVQAGDRSRLVLNLKQATSYHFFGACDDVHGGFAAVFCCGVCRGCEQRYASFEGR
mgnify:CR=1 FL=1